MTTSPFDPVRSADVATEPAGPGWTLVFVRELQHPPERVWDALTEPAQVSAWAPFTSDRDLGRLGTVDADDDRHRGRRGRTGPARDRPDRGPAEPAGVHLGRRRAALGARAERRPARR